MSTTTQILFNSPALHSLKRDQLVKLCKIHSIKASGKNVELIEKLKKHAETLPKGSPLSVAARSEGDTGVDRRVDETMDHDLATEVELSQSNAHWGFQMPRPSEQWEVVMESIEEIEERGSQGTLNSLRPLGGTHGGSGEFGTGMSKSSSVSSSIKALASSFGLKRRNTSKSTLVASSSFPSSSSSKSMLYLSSRPPKDEELEQHATPYSSHPKPDTLPQTDHFTFDPTTNGLDSLATERSPLPGHTLRPGAPAPVNARLSLGLNPLSTPTRKEQPTTTIRLISNPVSNDNNSTYGRTPQLKPFKTSFDLVLGKPQLATGGFRGVSIWPTEGGEEKAIYPPMPIDLSIASPSTGLTWNKMDTDEDEVMPGSLPLAPKPTSLKTPGPSRAPDATAQLTVPDPFVFGSPLPQHNVSNAQFKSAAASVLEEMNKRLQNDGVQGVGMDLIGRLQPGAHANGVLATTVREAKEAPKTAGLKEKFDEQHAEEFNKMEGIDSFVRRRAAKDAGGAKAVAGTKRKSSVGHGVGRDRFGRRVGDDGVSGRISATRVISGGRRARVIPGSFDGEGSDDEDGEEFGGADEGNVKRVRVDSTAMVEDRKPEDEAKARANEEKVKAEEEERKQREKEAIRRKLELKKARRRSSAGIAGARGRVSVGQGGVLMKPQLAPAKPSRFGFLSSAKSLVQKVWGSGNRKVATGSTRNTSGIPKPASRMMDVDPTPVPALVPPERKVSSIGNARPSTTVNLPASRVSSLRIEKDTAASTATLTSSQSRSPLPSVASSSSTRSSLAKPPTRTSSITASSKANPGISSIGTRTSMSSTNRLVGSTGAKLSIASAGRPSNSTVGSSSRLSTRMSSSRLLAPTASSLAKSRTSVSGSSPGSIIRTFAETSGAAKTQSIDETVGLMTNSPRTAKGSGPWSSRPGGIFSKPLTAPSGSGIPTPIKKRPIDPSTASGSGGPGADNTDDTTDTAGFTSMAVPPARQRSITGRKPRISRSKVIAKLASQRAAGTGAIAGPVGGTPARGAGRTRSSLGAKAQRSSLGGKPGASKLTGDGVLMSAKKRARQSEYARRRSKVAPIAFGGGADRQDMDLDAE